MSIPVPLRRVLLGLAGLCGGLVAVVGALELGPSGLVAVGMAGALVACLAAGVARESPGADRRSTLEAAAQAGGWAVGVLLVLSGTAVLAGGVVATILGVAVAGAVVGVALMRSTRSRQRTGSGGATVTPLVSPGNPRPVPAASAYLPVPALSTRALGQEWVRTTALLAGHLTADARVSVVRRRQETLDELELRDSAGFARWLVAGSGPASDPADYVQGDRTAGTDAA